MNNSLSLIALLSLFLGALSCTEHAEDHDHDHETEEAETHHEEDENSVSLSTVQMESIGLETGLLELKNLTSSIKASGFLKVPNQNKATVTSLYSGVVKDLHVMSGSTVSKGQVIATIVNPQFIQIQEEFLGLAPRIELAESEYKRQQELGAGNAGALKNLQTAESELKALRIRSASLERQLQLMGIDPKGLAPGKLAWQLDIKTPIGGSVGEVLVNIGASVDASTPIAEVVDNSQLHLDLFLYEKDLLYIGKGQTVNFMLTNIPGKTYSAEVFSVGTTFENESKSIAVHCLVKGDKRGLIEGMNVTAQISVDDAKVPALPDEAFVNREGTDYVFIQKDETDFEKIPVKKGVSELGFTEVTLLGEVPEGAKFVVKGAFFLLAKMTNAGEAHQH